jgi:3-deoxy-D-manno-octulosonic-acid transferase
MIADKLWRRGYTLLLWAALPFVIARLWWRGRKEPGYRRHVPERFGRYRAQPQKPVIWLHAVSVGETRAAEPLVRLLASRHPECELLITQMTATGRQTAERVFGGMATLAFLPYDYPFAVKRFLARFRPRLGVLMETEIWFNLVQACADSEVPLLLANARLSEKSARGYERIATLTRSALARLSGVAAQTDADAQRLTRLGARTVEITGNLKFDVVPPTDALALGAEFRRRYGPRKVLLAASTREGEEAALLDVLSRSPLAPTLVVIVPRHPQRFAEVAKLLVQRGLPFVRRSDNAPVPAGCAFVLGDSLGEMAAYYASCDLTLIGGSLLPYGAQNLIEACAAGTPVLIGASTYNFAQAAAEAVACGAALRIADAAQAVAEAGRLLGDEPARKRMSVAGLAFCAAHRGAAERTAAICERLLGAG